MIAYNQYTREDGTTCSAVQFHGKATGHNHIFEVLEILNSVGLKASWVDEETTDLWEEYLTEEGRGDVRLIVIPEHLKTQASDEELKVGDFIVMRGGDTYIQDGRTFEAVWTLVESTLTDLGEFFQRRELEA